MTVIAASIVTGTFGIGAVVLSSVITKIRRDLQDCMDDRRQLRRTLQLFANALMAVLPARQRHELGLRVGEVIAELEEEAT